MAINLNRDEIRLILKNPLFSGFSEETVHHALRCLKGESRWEHKGSVLYPVGEIPTKAAIILEGMVDVSQLSMHGHHMLISRINKGELVAGALVCTAQTNDFLDIRTFSNSNLLYLALPSKNNHKQICCPYYNRILQNLVFTLAEKTVLLNKKVQILGQRSLRDKLLCHFKNMSCKQNSQTIQLGYTREILASIISADRSAVCRELNNMQRDGLISLQKNTLTLTCCEESLN